MKLNLTDQNYCATIVKIDRLFPLQNSDNLLGFSIFGFTAIVSKDTKEGDVGVVFTAETKLSHEYLSNNNMYRDSELNRDKSQKGYIEANRRVRAVKLRGNISSALFMPIESLSYMCDITKLNIGDTFNDIDGVVLCEKYVIYNSVSRTNKTKGKTKTFKKIDNTTFPEHIDTENYFRNKGGYSDDDNITITQKIHGTSLRMGYVRCKKQLKRYEKLLYKLGINISTEEYDYIYASRRVIKNGLDVGYYKNDVWKLALDKYKSSLPKDWIFYGEIIGRDGDKPLQKDYTYNLDKGDFEVYIYRITSVNPDGVVIEMPLEEVVDWCNKHGMKSVKLLWKGKHKDFVAEDWIDKKFFPNYDAVPLCKESPVDEGVVCRRDCPLYVTKAKSPIFLLKETKDLDNGIVDLESNESNLG